MSPTTKEPARDKLRLDKWLWAARFYKTRRLAAEAIAGGKVHLNEQRIKPSKEIRINDTLQISKQSYRWTVVINGLNSKRRPAPEARLLYEESSESYQRRQAQIATNKALACHLPNSEKPNKKQRRQIHRFKRVT